MYLEKPKGRKACDMRCMNQWYKHTKKVYSEIHYVIAERSFPTGHTPTWMSHCTVAILETHFNNESLNEKFLMELLRKEDAKIKGLRESESVHSSLY